MTETNVARAADVTAVAPGEIVGVAVESRLIALRSDRSRYLVAAGQLLFMLDRAWRQATN